MSDIFGFLGGQSAVPLPEGDGVFQNRGFVGQLLAARRFKFWCAEDYALYDPPYKEGVDYQKRGSDNSWWYYFQVWEAAKAAADMLKAFAPGQVWRFEMPTASVLNFTSDKGAEAWGQAVSSDARITTMGSLKYRHEYHFITLPSLVDALARRAGFIKERIFHYDEVLGGMADEDYTDHFHWKMVGHPDANAKDAEAMAELLAKAGGNLDAAHALALATMETDTKVRIHYTYSTLWQRRAALWKALGETNAGAYLLAGTATTEKGKSEETQAHNLSLCLSASVREWVTPVWARFAMVADPTVSATYKSKTTGQTRRNTLPFVIEIFADEAAARAALGDETTTTPAVASTGAAAGTPPVPTQWGSEIKFWKDELAARKQAAGGVLPIMPALLAMSKELACTPDDIKAWWGLV